MDYQQYSQWSKRSVCLLVFSSVLSGIFTFNGLLGDYSFGFALLMASIGVVMSVAAFSFLFSQFPKAGWQKRKRLLWVGLVASVLLLLTSTQYSIFGLSGDKAKLHHLSVSLKQAEDKFSEIISIRKREQRLIPSLQNMEGVFRGMASREVTGGALSRKVGHGPVSANLAGLSQGYKEAVSTLKRQDRAVNSLFTRGSRLLDDIRGVVNDQELPVNAKNEQVQRKFMKLNTLFAEAQNSVLPSIVSLVERIDSLFTAGSDRETDEVLKGVVQPLAESKTLILSQIAELGSQEIRVPSFRVMGSQEAVITYWGICLPGFSYALAIDLVIPIMLLFFLTYLASGSDQNDFRQPPKDKENGKYENAPISPSPVWDAIRNQSGNGNGNRPKHVAIR